MASDRLNVAMKLLIQLNRSELLTKCFHAATQFVLLLWFVAVSAEFGSHNIVGPEPGICPEPQRPRSEHVYHPGSNEVRLCKLKSAAVLSIVAR